MRYMRKYGRLGLLLLAVALVVLMQQAQGLQESYASEMVRFHVLANSDSEEDQEVKLKVRDRVGGYISELLKDAGSREETMEILEAHIGDIERVAIQEIRCQGYSYDVTASLEQEDFPVKTYGRYHLPAGEYTSLQIRIGEAEGANWWCVAYPNMCFMDSVYEVVNQSEKEQLYQVFTLYEYRKLIESPNKEIRWRFFSET